MGLPHPAKDEMVRLKFLLFALLVLALWAGHLLVVSPALTARAVEQAGAHARAAAQAVRAAVAERRAEVAQVALSFAHSQKLSQVARAPASDRAAQLAALVKEQAPEALRSKLVVGAGNDAGGTFLRAEGSPVTGGDAAMFTAAGTGDVVDVEGVAHTFVTFPLTVGADGKPTTVAAIGLPMISEQAFDDAIGKTGLASVALMRGTQVIAQAGTQKDVAARAATSLAPGESKIVERAGAARLVGLSLPMFTEGDLGEAPSLVGARDAIAGSPYEIVAVASTRSFTTALATYQRTAIPVTLALFLLSLFWLAWIGRGVQRAAGLEPEEAPAQLEAAPPAHEGDHAGPEAPAPSDAPQYTEPGAHAPQYGEASDATGEAAGHAAYAQAADAPFADSQDVQQDTGLPPPSREDLPFPSGGHDYSSPPIPDEPGGAFAFGDTAPPPTSTPPPMANYAFESEQTRAYPTAFNNAGSESYASDSNEPPSSPGDNPDATRVAMIPQALIDASSRPTGTEMPVARPSAMKPPSISMPPVAAASARGASTEEQHFQDVYREFVSTREKCGEGADGLTFDKFVGKLRKNKEQLVQKYNCRTVRFQVYVKDGKAALKATPVRE